MLCGRSSEDPQGLDEVTRSNRKPTNRPHWLIQGFDGLSKIYERRIDGRHISEENVQLLLKTLAAKIGLTVDEIVGAYTNRRAQIANGLLHVSRDGPRRRFTCGENPHFIAVYRRTGR